MAVILLFIMVTYAKIGLENRDNELKVKKVELERQLKDLEDDKEQIESYRQYVQSDEYIEDVARKKLGLVYPDEVVFEADDSE